jgi:glycosyltransferase involved in cell wall biosynthesis
MKIIHVIDSLASGGKERQLVELLKGLTSRNNVVSQLVVLSDDIYYSYVKNLDIKTHLLPRRTRNDPSIFVKLYKICKAFQPDIIHSWESMCSVYAIPIAKILDAKFINGIIRFAPPKSRIFAKGWIRSRLTFRFSDIVLANSYAGLKSYNAPKHKSVCIYNGFDFSRTDNLQDKDFIKNKFKIHTPYVVGMVARFHIRKDYETFILSAMRLLKRREDVTFLMVGAGNTLTKCKNLVLPKFHDKIRFLGEQEDIESLVNIFDIGVLISYAEGISNSIMEYMALGKPVVATDHGGTCEIVIDNETGFLVNPKRIDEVVNKIEFFLNNNGIAKEMGNNGKKRLYNEFGIEKMTARHLELYEKCMRQVL